MINKTNEHRNIHTLSQWLLIKNLIFLILKFHNKLLMMQLIKWKN